MYYICPLTLLLIHKKLTHILRIHPHLKFLSLLIISLDCAVECRQKGAAFIDAYPPWMCLYILICICFYLKCKRATALKRVCLPLCRFRQCLQEVNDTVSSMVGYSFFNVLQVPCFELKYQKRCTQMYWWGM